MNELKVENKEIRKESRKERELFAKAVYGFNTALEEFAEFSVIGEDVKEMKKDLDDVKEDVAEIKSKM